ncbi:MAG: beta-ketoacyl synthase N-terminal-like domain-containing protein [bacterium]|nr:beta-ketoacyl synthase N-terminal-like domain-containing protein [bacterium]
MSDSLPVYIYSAAALGPHGDLSSGERAPIRGDAQNVDLSDLMDRFNTPELRRASHFSQLSLISASEAIRRLDSPIDETAPLYFSTGLGEELGTSALFEDVMQGRGESSSPFAFVNSVNNTTAFFLSKIAGLSGQSLIISQEEFSFECALRSACGDISLGESCHALVGGTDEVSLPRADHLTRIDLREDQPAGEGSGWLYLGKERAKAIGEIVILEEFTKVDCISSDMIGAIIKPCISKKEKVRLLPGFRLTPEEISALGHFYPQLDVMDYLKLCGCFHTASAFGLASIFDKAEEEPVLYFHVNRNAYGRLFIVGIRVFDERPEFFKAGRSSAHLLPSPDK